jgi:putative component of toxin-antitoxin plasmid stabilization module
MIEVREYTEPHGRSPFQQWFEDLDTRAAPKVSVALSHMEQRNVSNVKGVGGRVLEPRIDDSPGYLV